MSSTFGDKIAAGHLGKCNIALAIQCEGNGHFTQAISIAHTLDRYFGLKVKCIFLNEALRTSIPQYLYDAFPSVPCFFVEGPVMFRRGKNNTLDKLATTANIVTKFCSSFQRGLDFIDSHIRAHNINLVINLLDLMFIWYATHRKPRGVHVVNVGTQFKSEVEFEKPYEHQKSVGLHKLPGILYGLWKVSMQNEMGIFLKMHHPSPLTPASMSTIALTPLLPKVSVKPAPIPLPLPGMDTSYQVTFQSDVDSCLRLGEVGSFAKVERKKHNVFGILPFLPKEPEFFVSPCFVSYTELSGMVNRNIHEIVPTFGLPADGIENVSRNNKTLHICGYINNSGFLAEIFDFCERSRSEHFHLYLFMKQDTPIKHPLPNLTTLNVNRSNFISVLSVADGLVCTAGVEAVCEAIVFEKPVFVVPNTDDPEQGSNAVYFIENIAGIMSRTNFDLTDFLKFMRDEKMLEVYQKECINARIWMEQAKQVFAFSLRDIVSRLSISSS